MRDLDTYKVSYYVDKYRQIRHQPEDLFESEKYFLPRCLHLNMRVLDIGCACGGFFNIYRCFDPSIQYCGIDISEVLVDEARRLYPDGQFSVVDATKLPFEDSTFDLAQVWGVTLHEPNYRELLADAWRTTQKGLIFDMRLQLDCDEIIDKEKCFVLNPGGVKNFYIVPNAKDFMKWLMDLEPKPTRIEIFAYKGKANNFTTLDPNISTLYMAGVGIFREEVGSEVCSVKFEAPISLSNTVRESCKSLEGICWD